MIISLPGAMQKFQVCVAIPKYSQIHYAHLIGLNAAFTAPLDLQPNDCVWVDLRNGVVEIVERGGIAIWRAGWEN